MSFLSKLKSFFSVKDNSIVLPRDVSLVTLEGFAPHDFKYGIEIYNDNATPMEFVVCTLEKSLNIKHKEAIDIMLSIHIKGGVVLPQSSFEEASEIANSITSIAKENNYELFCRAVNVQQGAEVDA